MKAATISRCAGWRPGDPCLITLAHVPHSDLCRPLDRHSSWSAIPSLLGLRLSTVHSMNVVSPKVAPPSNLRGQG
jgi:hypothetical protein